MRVFPSIFIVLAAVGAALTPLSGVAGAGDVPLQLHPQNPNYFLFRGKPTILITSGEHYGAVLNLDFDYKRYLETLAREGLNLTRTFSGAYVEPDGAFNIRSNTLAPAAGRFIAPWARSDVPGYPNGGNKFDLSKWNPDYFARLKDFMSEASRRGVVVELNLFCPFYEEVQWKISPQNAANNVNRVGGIERTRAYTLDQNGGLLKIQEALVRKIVSELKDFDNLYYEICNEPYFGGVTLEWQHHIAEVISDAEKGFEKKHLISQNIANGARKVDQPHSAVSILNFHYAIPPDAVRLNYGLNRLIGDNETGFLGTNDAPYRMEAWDFLIAGGGLYNNLDYSFVAGFENGTFVYPASQPGGGNPEFRRQLGVLRDFMSGFSFLKMKPEYSLITSETLPGLSARFLADPGKEYAGYLRTLPIPAQFSVRWTGELTAPDSGSYKIHIVSNDGARLWLDEKLVIDDWTAHADREASAEVQLEGGSRHPLRIEYFQEGGTATMQLAWTRPGKGREMLPVAQLTHGNEAGLKAEYFAGKQFTSPRMTRVDSTIDFQWGNRSPFAREEKGPGADFEAKLPAGDYRVEWIDPVSGRALKTEKFRTEGLRRMESPPFQEDLAVRIRRLAPTNASTAARPKLF